MRMVAAALAVAALAGCGTQRTLEQEIALASNVDLCEVFLYGNQNMTELVRPEVSRRGVNCREYEPAILSRQQNRALASSRPAPVYTPYQVPMPQPIQRQTTNCTSQVVGNQVQTVCR